MTTAKYIDKNIDLECLVFVGNQFVTIPGVVEELNLVTNGINTARVRYLQNFFVQNMKIYKADSNNNEMVSPGVTPSSIIKIREKNSNTILFVGRVEQVEYQETEMILICNGLENYLTEIKLMKHHELSSTGIVVEVYGKPKFYKNKVYAGTNPVFSTFPNFGDYWSLGDIIDYLFRYFLTPTYAFYFATNIDAISYSEIVEDNLFDVILQACNICGAVFKATYTEQGCVLNFYQLDNVALYSGQIDDGHIIDSRYERPFGGVNILYRTPIDFVWSGQIIPKFTLNDLNNLARPNIEFEPFPYIMNDTYYSPEAPNYQYPPYPKPSQQANYVSNIGFVQRYALNYPYIILDLVEGNRFITLNNAKIQINRITFINTQTQTTLTFFRGVRPPVIIDNVDIYFENGELVIRSDTGYTFSPFNSKVQGYGYIEESLINFDSIELEGTLLYEEPFCFSLHVNQDSIEYLTIDIGYTMDIQEILNLAGRVGNFILFFRDLGTIKFATLSRDILFLLLTQATAISGLNFANLRGIMSSCRIYKAAAGYIAEFEYSNLELKQNFYSYIQNITRRFASFEDSFRLEEAFHIEETYSQVEGIVKVESNDYISIKVQGMPNLVRIKKPLDLCASYYKTLNINGLTYERLSINSRRAKWTENNQEKTEDQVIVPSYSNSLNSCSVLAEFDESFLLKNPTKNSWISLTDSNRDGRAWAKVISI